MSEPKKNFSFAFDVPKGEKLPQEIRRLLGAKAAEMMSGLLRASFEAVMVNIPAELEVGVEISKAMLRHASAIFFSLPVNDAKTTTDVAYEKVEQFVQHCIEFMANHVSNEEYNEGALRDVRRILKSKGFTPDEDTLHKIMKAARGVWLAQPPEGKSS